MRKILSAILLATVGLPSIGGATPIALAFDELPIGIEVANTYAASYGVIFSNAETDSILLRGSTAPIIIKAKNGLYNAQPSNPITAIFSQFVYSVTLTGLDVGENGFLLQAFDSVSGGNLLATSQIIGIGNGRFGDYYTLSVAGSMIKRVEFSQVRMLPGSGDGIAFDNFIFEPNPISVPEPSILSLFGIALLSVFAGRRLRK